MPHSRTYHHCLLQAAAVLTRQVIWLLVWFKQNVLPLFYLFSWQYPCSQLIACVEGEAHNIFSDIQNLLTTHRSELTHFTQELREVSYNLCWFHISLQIFEHFNNDHKSYLEFAPAVLQSFLISLDRTKEMSTFIIGLFDKYVEETSKLHSHSNNTHEAQMKSIEDFQIAYEVRHLYLFSLTVKIRLVYI